MDLNGSRRAAVVALFLLGVLAGCSGGQEATPAAVPASVSELEPCELLTVRERSDLRLRSTGPGDYAEEGPRRSCTFFTELMSSTVDEEWILLLELVIRETDTPNRVGDAERIARTYEQERGVPVTTTTVDGREIYRLESPDGPLGCRLLFTVNASSSVEAAVTMTNDGDPGASRCEFGGLPNLLSPRLPRPDPQPTAGADRPAFLLTMDPCTLIPAARRTALALDGGTGDTEPVPSCSYRARGTGVGALTFVSATVWNIGAKALTEDHDPTAVTVGGRTAYRTWESTGQVSTRCGYVLEVTTASSVEVWSTVKGPDPVPACRVSAELAAEIEPRLPPVVI